MPDRAQPLQVLLLEDSAADAELIRELLGESLPDADVVHAGALGEAVELLQRQPFHVVLTDLSLPDAFGIEAPRRLQEATRHPVPVVVLGRPDDVDVHAALADGAQDYLFKSELTAAHLARSVRYAISRAQAEEEARRSRGWAQSVLDAIEASTCAVDEQGVIVATNAAWDQFAAENGGDPSTCGVGANYLSVSDSSDDPAAQELAAGLRQMLMKGTGRLELEYACHSPQGERWCMLRATPVSGGGAAVLTHMDVTALRKAHQEVDFAATHDPLTGLGNRRLLMRTLQERLLDARPGACVAVVFLDIDRFKTVNDGLGHTAGDALLVRVAAELTGAVRTGDLVIRHGGDEFVVVATVADEVEAGALAGRLQAAVNCPLHIDDTPLEVTASFGLVVAAPGVDVEPDDVLRAADAAMHAAKAAGRSTIAVFSRELHDRTKERAQLSRELRAAVDGDQLVLHYQPIVDSRHGTVHAVEALLRWQHPQRGLLSPGDFLDVAESTGLIVPIGELVVAAACEQGRRWHDAGLPVRVAVNLSARQLVSPGMVDAVAGAVVSSGLPAPSLIVEVTETAMLDDGEPTRLAVEGVKALGVQLAIDDFGTGYSSLSYVQRYPVDSLKVDRSFVRDIVDSSDDRAIVASLVRLGKDLGLTVVAEGVETHEQLAVLKAMGCDLIQGFLYSRPVPADAVAGAVRAIEQAAPAADHGAARALRAAPVRNQDAEVSAELRGRVRELRAQGMSLHTLAAALNAEGLRAPSGLRWHPRSVARVMHVSA